METLRGQIEEIIYYNEDNGYLVAAVETREDEFITAVGYLPLAREGHSYELTGETREHPAYGQQFSFFEYREILPTAPQAIQAFLSSGILKGVGRKMAGRIVDFFGRQTMEILEKNPERLALVEGIGDKTAESIGRQYREHREISRVVMFLQNYGISASYAVKLYHAYGKDTLERIRENPYQLVDDVGGIGFKTADQIAMQLGLERESEFRIAGGIKFLLNRAAGEGHTFLPEALLREQVSALLEVSGEKVGEALPDMALEGQIRMENLENRRVVFLMPYYMAETGVCRNLMRLLDQERLPVTRDLEGLMERAQGALGIQLADRQKEAVRCAAENGVCVITGGPGTGKTTAIHTIIQIFEESGMKTAIAAPTGRAAKRITEASGYEAKTIHRLLEYSYSEKEEGSPRFARNRENPLEAEVVIIDEASMIDILLMNGLLNGLRDGARLILVGDADQLPPVGAGNVLRDIIESELVHTVRLDEIFRQAQESLIVVNAHRINRGEYPSVNEKDKDFFFLQRQGDKKVLNTLLELCTARLPEYYQGLDPLRDFQVLTPTKKGLLGTESLNRHLQAALNPPASGLGEKALKKRLFREGDKVMQTRNNYEIKWKRTDDFSEGEGIFNGDIGYIHMIDQEENRIVVIFEDVKAVSYDMTQMEELELAYAVTVHKSQGSEYPVVIMPMVWFPPMLATRNLLYTAVTRAKRGAVLVGQRQVMNAMVDNNRITGRYSGLKARLRGFLTLEGREEEEGL